MHGSLCWGLVTWWALPQPLLHQYIWSCVRPIHAPALRTCSGYDFGYLLKTLTCQPLPPTEGDFFEVLHIFFPNVYDIKYLMKFCDNMHGGLNKLAELLDVSVGGMSGKWDRRGTVKEVGHLYARKCMEGSTLAELQGVSGGVGLEERGRVQVL